MATKLELLLVVVALALSEACGVDSPRTYNTTIVYQEAARRLCPSDSHVLVTGMQYEVTDLKGGPWLPGVEFSKLYRQSCEHDSYCGWPQQEPAWLKQHSCCAETCLFRIIYKCITHNAPYTVVVEPSDGADERLCPSKTIVGIDNVSCRGPDGTHWLATVNEAYLLKYQLHCDGRRKCPLAKLAKRYHCPNVTEWEMKHSAEITYRCLEADAKGVSCSGQKFRNVSCEAKGILTIQQVLFGAICVNNSNKSCIEEEDKQRPLYMKIAKQQILDKVKRSCDGRSECRQELFAEEFRLDFCLAKEVKDIRVYFRCDDNKFFTNFASPRTLVITITLTILSLFIGICIGYCCRLRLPCLPGVEVPGDDAAREDNRTKGQKHRSNRSSSLHRKPANDTRVEEAKSSKQRQGMDNRVVNKHGKDIPLHSVSRYFSAPTADGEIYENIDESSAYFTIENSGYYYCRRMNDLRNGLELAS